MKQVFQDEINAAEAQRRADTEAFLGVVEQRKPITQEAETNAVRLSKYGIDSEMWDNWAAAAGYPGAKWDDTAVARRVAEYAADQLMEMFGNWGLVAIGWRYGPGAARAIQQVYGNSPANEIVTKMLGSAGATFYNSVLDKVGPPQEDFFADFNWPTYQQPGNVELRFVNEQGEPSQRQSRGASKAHTALIGVLARMRDQQISRITEVEPQVVGEDRSMPRNAEDSDMGGI